MVQFSKNAAERVKAATIIVEKMDQSTLQGHKRYAAPYDLGFWAKITDDKDGKKYGWVALEPKATDELEDNEDMGSGSTEDESGYAVEATGSEWVLKDSIVWMMPSKNQAYYLFYYAPGLVNAKVGTGEFPAASSAGYPRSGTVTVKRWVNGSFTDGESITVYNPFQTALPANTWLELTYGDGVWWISGADCEES